MEDKKMNELAANHAPASSEELAAERAAIAAERAAIAAERAALNGPTAADAALATTETDTTDEPVWQYQTTEFSGLTLQYRPPQDGALLALGMSSGSGLPPELQMKIFTAFLMNHVSATSLEELFIKMSNSDSGIKIEHVIKHIISQK